MADHNPDSDSTPRTLLRRVLDTADPRTPRRPRSARAGARRALLETASPRKLSGQTRTIARGRSHGARVSTQPTDPKGPWLPRGGGLRSSSALEPTLRKSQGRRTDWLLGASPIVCWQIGPYSGQWALGGTDTSDAAEEHPTNCPRIFHPDA
uniref:Isoform 3 of Centromere protein T n=1 Tax=Homo sapiens TaxID=9606 RepID=Q96BT3-3|nr:unnamed protein product [Homo sapiens]